jgi:sugar-specific transcriptional regulator TrmB
VSREWAKRTLMKLGFTETDAQVYIFLSTEGPQELRDMAEALKLQKLQLCHILKKMQNFGIITTSSESPARYSAVDFEDYLDLLVKDKMKQQQVLQESRKELLSIWQKMTTEKLRTH